MNELIHKYLQGTLTQKEKEKIEKLLHENAAFREELEFQKELKDAILEEDIMDLRSKLNNIVTDNQKQINSKKKIFNRKYISIAAGLLLLVAVGGYFLFQTEVQPSKLYKQYYTPYENIYSVRSLNIKYEGGPVEKAFLAYENEQWKTAEEYYSKLIVSYPQNYSFIFYSGIVKLELDKNEEALEKFQDLTGESQNLFTEQAYWYAALTCLKMDKLEEARKYLHQIIEKGMEKEKQAERILKRL